MSRAEKQENYLKVLGENHGIIVKLCRGYTNTPQDLEDNIQEVKLQVWRSIDNFKGKAKTSTWIYKITLNVCLYMLSKRKKKLDAPVETGKLENLSNDHAALFKKNNPVNILYQSIQVLEPIDRGIIMLYLDKKKHAEIATILGMSLSNVSVRINRIKKRLKLIANEQLI